MEGITKTFPGVAALSDVNLSVRRGEIHAICGENGAGKSTLMKVLSGVYPHGSYDGEITFDGEVCAFASIRDSEHRGIVIIHQELALCAQLSIAENIFLGNERATRGLIDWNRTNHEAERLLARVGLREKAVIPVRDIGIGKQQLVEIAKALSKDVKLLILDEPTAAISFSLWMRITQVMPSARRPRSTSSRCAESSSLSAAVGSSRISSRTSLDSALAISTSCCLPTPRSTTGVTGRSSSPTRRSRAAAAALVRFQSISPRVACSLPRKMF